MKISLTKSEVLNYSKRFNFDGDDKLSDRIKKAVQRGSMTRTDLIAVAKWKWRGGRTRQLVTTNTEMEIREITAASFSASSERLRIGSLLALHGVDWPMASVILHFSFPGKYPILDVRAMRAVNGSTVYNFDRWLEYCSLCRKTARAMGITMRELDRALWASDKETRRSRAQTKNI